MSATKAKVTFTVKTEVGFTDQQVSDLVTTALEGGSNYWIGLLKRIGPKAGRYYCDQVIQGGGYEVWGNEEEEGKLHGKITRETCLKGLQLMAEKRPDIFAKFIGEDSDYDADDADIFLQYAVLGEVVYG